MILPWIIAGLTAVWFGVLAHKAGRTAVLWAVGGALYSLCLSTMVLGLAEAASIPMSTAEEVQHAIKRSVAAVVVCVAVGLVATAGLYKEAAARRRKAQAAPSGSDRTG